MGSDRRKAVSLFLGAGASRPFGIPVTAELLPGILRRLDEATLFDERPTPRTAAAEARKDLRDGLERLVPGLFRGIAPPLLTDLLSLVDQLVAEGHATAPGLSVRALDRLRVLLEQATAEALARPVDGEAHEPNRPLLDRLVDWISACAGEDGPCDLRVISTNYDVVLEKRLYALFDGSLADAVDFGMSWREAARPEPVHPRPARPRLGLYKLHGSLDWLRCALCGHVYVDPARTIFREGGQLERGSGRACACGYRPLRHLIVAPSTVREVRDPNLLSIWQAALEALRTSDEWIVIGYSMPPEDVATRSLLVRAFHGRPRPPAVTVIGRGEDREMADRYRLLFPELRFEPGGVEGFVESLHRRS